MVYHDKKLKIFSCTANKELAQAIAEKVGCKLGDGEVVRFSDGEITVRIGESVRGADVFIIQSTNAPANDNLMELLIMIDACRRASARRITAVIPYYGYARQERKAKARDPITAKLVANLITVAGADRVLTLDLHAPAIQGFYDIPVDHLTAVPLLAEYYKKRNLENTVVVSPDMGGVTRARDLAERLRVPLAIMDKRRPKPNVSEILNIIGDIKDKDVIMVDDIIDTAGTISQGAAALLERGAKSVTACCTHPVFSGPAIERLEKSPLQEVVVTDSIALSEDKKIEKITQLSLAELFADAIVRIHEDLSISELFN
ncbi:ribose-phosphate pyrophosphokinase [Anaerobranca californiensis DSM 14826]|uniref:Ribose-phosphate pyrophosphokinase n=1 Tax=Anaerobranca californiensis DSM 14826 TaxID=1120989 RepID=A0A1M6PJ30_9FIRM|nr:ribose-phosphate pyrophosphokinase [Anaerobranca californiensis]SHK07962.1 ribose-phosphate pyrophosphokinase [Anaerobranca californiensis DSM 14826]